MGRSARWHDPQLQAEIAAEEIAAAGSRRLAVQLALVGLSGGIDGPAALFTVPRLVRVLIRLVDRYRRARRG